MNALVFKDIGKIEPERIPVPEIEEPDQVLIKVSKCGICGSDVKILQGKHAYKKNTVLGHEFNGVVVDTGSKVRSVKAGDRVSIDNNPRCGICDFCRTGFSSQCEIIKEKTIGIFQNGGYAEYCIAPESVCFKLPEAIDDVVATQVETLGTVLNGMNVVQMQPSDTVLILGCGPIGYLFAALVKNIAAMFAVTEIDAFRLDVARAFGAPVFNPDHCDLEKEVMELTRGKKFDIVIDAVGTQLENAVKYVTPGGKVLAFGMDDSAQATIKPYYITRNAIKILGTYIGQNTCLPAIKILENHRLDLGRFFTKEIPLKEGKNAFPELGLELGSLKQIPKQAMKIVLNCTVS